MQLMLFYYPNSEISYKLIYNMSEIRYKLTEDYIELYQVLKLCNLVGSGGEAKVLITSGEIKVNQIIETRKKKKLYSGDIVQFKETVIHINK